MERRFFNSELRADSDDGNMLSGYAAVFNSLSQVIWGFREKIAPGAFADTLADDVRALWNHDTGIVLGRTKSGTLRLHEDDTGLRIEIDPPDSASAQVESVKRGDVDQMSFGFKVLEDGWDQDDEGMIIRTLRKIKLFEVSPVTFPAYTATSVGVRAEPGQIAAWGEQVEIPAELRRATGEAGEDGQAVAQARAAYRRRHIDLYEFL